MPAVQLSWRHAWWLGAGLLLTFVICLTFLAHIEARIQQSSAYQVVVDGYPIAYVGNPETAFQALAMVQQAETEGRGYPVLIDNVVVTEPAHVDPSIPRLTVEELVRELAANVDFVARGVAVMVDSEPVVVLADEDQAQATVESLIEEYRQRLENGEFPPPGQNRINETVVIETIEPVEDIRFEAVKADPAEVKSASGATDVLVQGGDEIVMHTVQKGESLWTIASKNRISVEELQAANPQVTDPHRLQPGDQLNLKVPTPHITLRSVERRHFVQRVPFETQVEEDPSRYPWEEYVKQKGEYGEREVTERVERIWGRIVSTEVISETVIKEPRPQIVVKGTKAAPNVGTGELLWPVRGGQLTSPFGYSRWRGRHHDGIDIAAPRGTALYAADNGVVTFAGWRSGLGQTIIIDHGGGKLQTVYAHLDSFAVSRGQQVQAGQKIGTIGCTGFCTGPNVHFEVLVNGKPVDPMKYLR